MDSQSTLESASSGASSNGFSLVETIAGSRSFLLLD
jgi:phosphoribosylaminoimidazole (AIR) synthetase